jgi:sialate O-acetylesterase
MNGDKETFPLYLLNYLLVRTALGVLPEEAWAWQREAQTYGLKEKNTAMIATHDVGEWDDIHPQNKAAVGERFALAAASMAGEKLISQGPLYKSFEIQDEKIMISFRNISGGLQTQEVRMNKNAGLKPGTDSEAFIARADKLTGFSIAGEDGRFYKAIAEIKNDQVVVSSVKVKKPLHVRYAWATFTLANLYNNAGLPAYPFRTDSLPMPKLYQEK